MLRIYRIYSYVILVLFLIYFGCLFSLVYFVGFEVIMKKLAYFVIKGGIPINQRKLDKQGRLDHP